MNRDINISSKSFAESFSDLEALIQERASNIVQMKQNGYQRRTLRTGTFYKQPLFFHYRSQLLTNRSWATSLTPEFLVHLLSLAGNGIPQKFHHAVNNIILIPELIKSNKYLLSHIYFPQEKIIACYLCPKMYLPNPKLSLESFIKNEAIQKRRGQYVNHLQLLGPLGLVFTRSIESYTNGSLQIKKFVLELKDIKKQEIIDLENVHELYKQDIANNLLGKLYD